MNITQYRAMKAQEGQVTPTVEQTPATVVPQVVTQTTPNQEPAKPETTPAQPPVVVPAVPEKISIDGIGEVAIDELKKGYMRTADYTRKTQDIAKRSKEVENAIALYEQIKQNPELAEQIKEKTPIPSSLDPATRKVVELEQKVYDTMLQLEINQLQTKYSDFEIREVLATAQEKNMTNLEDAYLLSKSRKPAVPVTQDAEALKAQIRQQILAEMEAEKNTQTIITTNGSQTPVQTVIPTISPAEQKVARMMKLSDADYVKWRDADGRNKK